MYVQTPWTQHLYKTRWCLEFNFLAGTVLSARTGEVKLRAYIKPKKKEDHVPIRYVRVKTQQVLRFLIPMNIARRNNKSDMLQSRYSSALIVCVLSLCANTSTSQYVCIRSVIIAIIE